MQGGEDMIAILTPVKEVARIKKWMRWCGRVHPVFQSVETGGFYHLPVIEQSGRVAWRGVAQFCQTYGARLLVPREIPVPVRPELPRYRADGFRQRLLLAGFLQLLERMEQPPDNLVLIDRGGRYVKLAEILLPRVGQVRVLTLYPERYRALCERAGAEYGTAPLVTWRNQALERADMILAPNGTGGEALPPSVPVFGPPAPGVWCLSDRCVELPKPYAALQPPGIRRLEFAGALTEGCEISGGCGAKVVAFSKNGGERSIQALAGELSGIGK